jgi:hypothetical protein
LADEQQKMIIPRPWWSQDFCNPQVPEDSRKNPGQDRLIHVKEWWGISTTVQLRPRRLMRT